MSEVESEDCMMPNDDSPLILPCFNFPILLIVFIALCTCHFIMTPIWNAQRRFGRMLLLLHAPSYYDIPITLLAVHLVCFYQVSIFVRKFMMPTRYEAWARDLTNDGDVHKNPGPMALRLVDPPTTIRHMQSLCGSISNPLDIAQIQDAISQANVGCIIGGYVFYASLGSWQFFFGSINACNYDEKDPNLVSSISYQVLYGPDGSIGCCGDLPVRADLANASENYCALRVFNIPSEDWVLHPDNKRPRSPDDLPSPNVAVVETHVPDEIDNPFSDSPVDVPLDAMTEVSSQKPPSASNPFPPPRSRIYAKKKTPKVQTPPQQSRVMKALSDLRVAQRSLRRNDGVKFSCAVGPLFVAYSNAPQNQRSEMLWNILDAPKKFALAGSKREDFKRKQPRHTATNKEEEGVDLEHPIDNQQQEKSYMRHLFKAIELAKGGAYKRAILRLCSSKAPLNTEEAGDELQRLNPQSNADLPVPPPSDFNHLTLNHDELITMLRRAKDTKAGGPSGWTEELLLLVALASPTYAEGISQVLTDLANGDVDDENMQRLTACRLIGLKKPSDDAKVKLKLRPIAIGEVFLRLAGRIILNKVSARLNDKFMECNQFAFASGGVDAIIHHTRLAFQHHKTFCTIDCSNAFNSIWRSAFMGITYSDPSLAPMWEYIDRNYGTKSALIFSQEDKPRVIWSESGVRQGDVLGPALFCLGLLPILHTMKTRFPEVRVLAYMDDITVIGDNEEEIYKAICFLRFQLSNIGLEFNMLKCFTSGPRSMELSNKFGK